MQNDVELVHEIEAVLGKQLEEFECKENEVLSDSTKVRSWRTGFAVKLWTIKYLKLLCFF